MPIAIIGISCRFPGDATNPEKLWKLVFEGRSAWSEIPKDRFNQKAFYHPQDSNLVTVRFSTITFGKRLYHWRRLTFYQTNIRKGHFLKEDISLFNTSFFNFSAEVAESMDPQYRLQLESTFEAMESQGAPTHLPIAGILLLFWFDYLRGKLDMVSTAGFGVQGCFIYALYEWVRL
jgi:acyl transferase domain-containing protein